MGIRLHFSADAAVGGDSGIVSVLPLLYVVVNRNYRRSASDVDPDRVKGSKFVRDHPARGMGGRVSAKVAAVGEGPPGGGGTRRGRGLPAAIFAVLF